MRAWGSAAAVVAALRDDAAAERERLERETETALEALRRASVAPPDDARDTTSERIEAARRAAADADAAEDWDDTVTAAADRDAWIAAVAAHGRRAVASGPAAQTWLARVTREAAAELPGDVCVVTVPAPMLAGAAAWIDAVARELKKTIRLEGGALTAGCVARTPDGRITFDNTVEARERRTHTAWRTAVARLYDEAVAIRPEPAEVA